MKKDSKYKQCTDLLCELNHKLDGLLLFEQIGKKPNGKIIPIKQNDKTPFRSNFMHKIAIIFTWLLLTSCAKAGDTITYVIKKGDHYSFKQHNICANVLEYDVYFDNSAKYDLGNSNQLDVNKLFGFNACNSLHHTNSARFGWVYTSGDSIDIYYYIYDFDVRYYGKICTIKLNSWNTYLLQNNGVSYVFKVNDLIYIYEKQSECITSYNYMLYPYFGGDEVAPHDVTIVFKKK